MAENIEMFFFVFKQANTGNPRWTALAENWFVGCA